MEKRMDRLTSLKEVRKHSIKIVLYELENWKHREDLISLYLISIINFIILTELSLEQNGNFVPRHLFPLMNSLTI